MYLTISRIAQHEKKARARHLSAVQYMGNDPLPSWFNDFLEQRVLPLLVEVGFDREIASNIFRISSPGWRSMGPVTALRLRLHSAPARDIRQIRQGIVSREPTDIAAKAMHPDTLFELVQSVPTTWIILPRIHSFLTKGDSRYLIVYLQHLCRETNLAFEKILARILIEFVGNYSLKFISSTLPKKQMIEAIFYGYAAMFWKNLRQPPPGLEDLLICRNYLSWARAFNKRASGKDTEKEAVLTEMEEIGNTILPDQNGLTSARRKDIDAGAMHISLRHSRLGINRVVQHFTMNTTSLRCSNHDHLSYRTLPRQINALFRELRHSYDHETPQTKEFIHTFLMDLKAAYSPRTVRSNLSGPGNIDSLDFTQSRMASLVQDFSRSLH